MNIKPLTEKQKKNLPPALQKAIIEKRKKMVKKGMKGGLTGSDLKQAYLQKMKK